MACLTTGIVERHGESIDLGVCLSGKNLNLLVLRGFAPLDVLAEISSPDVYDQVDNQNGTQHALKAKHTEECFNYAIGSITIAPEDEPRVFPEIILNARDMGVVEIYDTNDPGELFDLNSFSDEGELSGPTVGVRILASELEFPKPDKSPQISRVDGNHRLHETDDVLDEWWRSEEDGNLDKEFPVVPFTLMLALDDLQEARLFRDINGEHVGMESAHLDQLVYRVSDKDTMKFDSKLRPLWLAHQLTEPGPRSKAWSSLVDLSKA